MDSRVANSIASTRSRMYDGAGRLTREVSTPDNRCHIWSYDVDEGIYQNRGGRLARVERQVWDPSGEQCIAPTASDEGFRETRYGYDSFGRWADVQHQIQSSTGLLTKDLVYDYDPMGNLRSLQYPSGRVVEYSRTNGRIDDVEWSAPGENPAIPSTNIADAMVFYPFRGIDGFALENGFIVSRTRDDSSRLDTYAVSHNDGQVVTELLNRDYDFDDHFDSIKSIVDVVNTDTNQNFYYDHRHRLREASGIYGDYEYDYDKSDNRTLRAFTLPLETNQVIETVTIESSPALSNRVSSVATDDTENDYEVTRSLDYDDRGNIVEDRKNNVDVLKYEFNDRNSLSVVRRKKVPEPDWPLGVLFGAGACAMLARRRASQAALDRRFAGGFNTFVALVGLVSFFAAAESSAQDFDGDQIPDAFEMASAGQPIPLDYMVAADGMLDFDGDGDDNTTEYLNNPVAGSDDIWNSCVNSDPRPIVKPLVLDKSELLVTGDVVVDWETECATEIRLEPGAIDVTVGDGTGSHTFPGISDSTWFTVIATNASGFRMESKEVEFFEIAEDNEYSPSNQRVQRILDGEERLFIYGPDGQVLAELDAAGAPQVEYVYLDGEHLARLHGSPSSTQTYYVHNSHLGAPEFLTDSSRDIAWQIHAKPFGETYDEPVGAGLEGVRFPGQYAEAELGISYNWHRYYDPSLGRYISADPIGQAGGLNLYTYALSNPIAYVDPYGLDPFLVARVTDTRSDSSGFGQGRPLGDHLFIATGADYPGDPKADIVAYAQNSADGTIEPRPNNATDYAAWLALSGPSCDQNAYSPIPATDEAVQAAAAAAIVEGDYAGLGWPFGTNSNEAAQAIANQASGGSVTTPTTGQSSFGPVGSGTSGHVGFQK